MLLLPRQSVARSALVNWSMKMPAGLLSDPVRLRRHFGRMVHEMTTPTVLS